MAPIVMLVASFAALVVAGRALAEAARRLGLPAGSVTLLAAIALR
jgi:hypothetical protein